MQTSYEIPEGDNMKRIIRSALEEAIYDVLGGPVPAAGAMQVSRQAVHSLLDARLVKSRAAAMRIEQATREAGREVPAAELMELIPWRGPDRHGGDDSPRRRRQAIETTTRAQGAVTRGERGAERTVAALRPVRRPKHTSRSRIVGTEQARG